MLYEEQSIRGADELLGPCVTDEILQRAEDWLYVFANRLGVAREDVVPGFLVQSLIAAYAYREVCYMKAYGAPVNAWNQNETSDDYFSRKLKYYDIRIRDLEKQITAADLTGNKPGSVGYRAVSISRG